MAPSFESAASSLLCAENNHGIFDDKDHYGGGRDVAEEVSSDSTWRDWVGWIGRRRYRVFVGGGSPVMPPMLSEECLGVMVEKERQHMPNADYLKRLRNGDLDLSARKQAIDWIAKVRAHFGFGPLCVYLSINYLDRFLSAYKLPKEKEWMWQLLAVASLSLAAKMEETEVPSSLHLQVGEAKYVFEAKTIQRMELLVLSTLGWRMQAITPFSFLDNFLNRMMNNGETPPRSVITLSIQLILATMKGIDFLEYRPSEIAAAVVAIAVMGETRTVERPSILLLSQYVEKEKVRKCVELIQDLSRMRNGGSEQVPPPSPNGVLEVCMSFKSDETTTPTTSTTTTTITPMPPGDEDDDAAIITTSSRSSYPTQQQPGAKRRKLHHQNSL